MSKFPITKVLLEDKPYIPEGYRISTCPFTKLSTRGANDCIFQPTQYESGEIEFEKCECESHDYNFNLHFDFSKCPYCKSINEKGNN